MHRTPLYDAHVQAGAKMVEFNGWQMPLQYTSITEEHRATRTAAGLFDLSHMGRIEFHGPDRERFLDWMTTAHVSRLPIGKGRYSFLCDPVGGVIDDIIIYRLRSFLGLVVNAGNREEVVRWLHDNRRDHDVEVRDRTFDLGMIAIQGPMSDGILQEITDIPLREVLPYYRARGATVADQRCMVSRTGYTGEDGFEIFVPREGTEPIWDTLVEIGTGRGMVRVGLGARDTLRLEAGMPLYGHELHRKVSPLEAGLGKFVSFRKDFIGREALGRVGENGQGKRLVGLEVDGRRIPRQGALVHRDGEEVGRVTSGTHAPSLGRTIALAYIEGNSSADGPFQVDVRGKMTGARLVAVPFYSRGK